MTSTGTQTATDPHKQTHRHRHTETQTQTQTQTHKEGFLFRACRETHVHTETKNKTFGPLTRRFADLKSRCRIGGSNVCRQSRPRAAPRAMFNTRSGVISDGLPHTGSRMSYTEPLYLRTNGHIHKESVSAPQKQGHSMETRGCSFLKEGRLATFGGKEGQYTETHTEKAHGQAEQKKEASHYLLTYSITRAGLRMLGTMPSNMTTLGCLCDAIIRISLMNLLKSSLSVPPTTCILLTATVVVHVTSTSVGGIHDL